jgi:hypothetical protein
VPCEIKSSYGMLTAEPDADCLAKIRFRPQVAGSGKNKLADARGAKSRDAKSAQHPSQSPASILAQFIEEATGGLARDGSSGLGIAPKGTFAVIGLADMIIF